jgi:hypothetical protein
MADPGLLSEPARVTSTRTRSRRPVLSARKTGWSPPFRAAAIPWRCSISRFLFPKQTRPVRLVAATVDHGLRPEAAGEAGASPPSAPPAAFEPSHAAWDGAETRGRPAAAAREARHRLLADAAMALDATMVLTGHTRVNDQAETVASCAASAATGWDRGGGHGAGHAL